MKPQYNTLDSLVSHLQHVSNEEEKLSLLEEYAKTQGLLQEGGIFHRYLQEANRKAKLVMLSIIAIGEGPIVLQGIGETAHAKASLEKMIEELWEVEKFYRMIGGIVGYHQTLLKLVGKESEQNSYVTYSKPLGIDIEKENDNTLVYQGLQSLPMMAEIYPIGGAGDRLGLLDEQTGTPLPAAKLPFCGKTLLEGLIRDVQAREYLFYKCFHRQITTPIAMMTSHEKNNHRQIRAICEECGWFSRPSKSFFFFVQPSVPMITKEGHWSMKEPLALFLKPGGHGVLWKLAQDSGAFTWLFSYQRKKALIRQINNPIAGIDSGLLAFCGFGYHHDKTFGFASCPRLLGAAEGMIVLAEETGKGEYTYRLSNIEYTDFLKKGIEDIPDSPGSPYSQFPANTNILFADLEVMSDIASRCPLPGLIVNMKKEAPCIDSSGKRSLVPAGRLESTMQNISDCLIKSFPKPLEPKDTKNLDTFIMYNKRRKTISVTKRSYHRSKPVSETPERCFFDLLQNYRDLLFNYCKMDVPELCSEQEFVTHGPNFIVHYHPALGPLFSIIQQKIQGGKLFDGGELQLEIAELEMIDLHLNGSLLIHSDCPLGRGNEKGILKYGEDSGKCTLHHVKIHNLGIDRSCTKNVYWKNQISHQECLAITLHGNAEFVAENIAFEGNHVIEVPDGYRFTAYEESGRLLYHQEKISSPTWFWDYSFSIDKEIRLEKTVIKKDLPRKKGGAEKAN